MKQAVINIARIVMYIMNITYTLTVDLFQAVNRYAAARDPRMGYTTWVNLIDPTGVLRSDPAKEQNLIRYFIRVHTKMRVNWVLSRKQIIAHDYVTCFAYAGWQKKAIRYGKPGVPGIYIFLLASTQDKQKTYSSVDIMLNEFRAMEDPSKSIFYYFYDVDQFQLAGIYGHALSYMRCSDAWKIAQLPISARKSIAEAKPNIMLSHYPKFNEYCRIIDKGMHDITAIFTPDKQQVFGWLVFDNRRNEERYHIPYFDDARSRQIKSTVHEGLFENDPELIQEDEDGLIDGIYRITRYDTDSQIEAMIYHHEDQFSRNRDFYEINLRETAEQLHATYDYCALLDMFDGDELLMDNSPEEIAEALIRRYQNDYNVILHE